MVLGQDHDDVGLFRRFVGFHGDKAVLLGLFIIRPAFALADNHIQTTVAQA